MVPGLTSYTFAPVSMDIVHGHTPLTFLPGSTLSLFFCSLFHLVHIHSYFYNSGVPYIDIHVSLTTRKQCSTSHDILKWCYRFKTLITAIEKKMVYRKVSFR